MSSKIEWTEETWNPITAVIKFQTVVVTAMLKTWLGDSRQWELRAMRMALS